MTEFASPPLPTKTRTFARELQGESTEAEQRLWCHLRAARLNGFKFRRQHPFSPDILDFHSLSAKLSIELDGAQHSIAVDAARTHFLKRNGIEILRFWDNDVQTKTSAVPEQILASMQTRALSPDHSPDGRGKTIASSPQ
jgi:very-short-patch-repair endonuclease